MQYQNVYEYAVFNIPVVEVPERVLSANAKASVIHLGELPKLSLAVLDRLWVAVNSRIQSNQNTQSLSGTVSVSCEKDIMICSLIREIYQTKKSEQDQKANKQAIQEQLKTLEEIAAQQQLSELLSNPQAVANQIAQLKAQLAS
jgi:pyruvoyl-dependent arginine decarboxylase (PvlArgDC)